MICLDYLCFNKKKKEWQSSRKTVHHKALHVGSRNLTLGVGILLGTWPALSLVKIPTTRVRYLYPTLALMVDCYILT